METADPVMAGTGAGTGGAGHARLRVHRIWSVRAEPTISDRHFDKDVERSERIDPTGWGERSAIRKVGEKAVRRSRTCCDQSDASSLLGRVRTQWRAEGGRPAVGDEAHAHDRCQCDAPQRP